MTPIQLSETSLCHILFNMTQSQVQLIRDEPYRFIIRKTFNEWLKTGNRFWREQSKVIVNTEHEEPFEELSALLYDGIREILASKDMVMSVALLKAYNQDGINIKSELPEGITVEP